MTDLGGETRMVENADVEEPTVETFPDLVRERYPNSMVAFVISDHALEKPVCNICGAQLEYKDGGLLGIEGKVLAQFMPVPFDPPEDDIVALGVVLTFTCSACDEKSAEETEKMWKRFMREFPGTRAPMKMRADHCRSCGRGFDGQGTLVPRRLPDDETTYLYWRCAQCDTDRHETTAGEGREDPL